MLTSGIIGLPMVGKTTLFNLVTSSGLETSNYLTGKTEINVGMATVPDPRVDFLSRVYKPRKTTYAQIQFSDVPGLVRGASEGKGVGNRFLDGIRNADLLVHVVRAFNNRDVPHVDGNIDPMRDIETINLELLLADMDLVEKRIQRIETGKKIKKEQAGELAVLRKCLEALENEVTVHNMELTDAERALLVNYSFLTDKPMILVINTGEDQLRAGSYPGMEKVREYADQKGIILLEVSGQIEMEISRLDEDDRREFMEDLGLKEPGIDRLARAAYDTLGLISFFTVGEDEVKAWTISEGTNAKSAAGKIHSDLERGFIRAEVVAYDDLQQLGSMSRVKEKGLARLEGKDYIIKDGDILNIRFNV
ncbi:redox-regulated ATPase YchF [Desulfallas sp. Bu1-1]|uniref:redox-regulated ATPase YchF n=1 Tax=Desulfallas sp. Bu1-1 TaxID=2787620 RepID=UPI00189E5B80|nr:redox-regulated ATPase YchF [Desulfallas sp. Bu1-1]MBF7082484.1 redox-regulated ATPase YchF [Desulfallas sp. Bu1-1]